MPEWLCYLDFLSKVKDIKYDIIEYLEWGSMPNFPTESILSLEGTQLPITSFSRPLLRAVLTMPSGHDVTVLVAHLKSKRPLVDDQFRHDQKSKATGYEAI